MKLTVLPAAILAVGALYAQTTSQIGEGADVRIEMRTASGQSAGTATLTETPHGVIVRYTPFNLPRGAHAVHLHEKGVCDGPSFESAGGHFNPARMAHGFASARGYHAGDLPNIAVSGERETHEQFVKNVTLKSGGSPLIDGDGASLVVHAGADDHVTDPSGNSGDRIACGVIG
jgi:Cu-Zn family superoxide dismutase